MLSVTSIYAGLLALLLVLLSTLVIRARLQGRVSVGDGGDKRLIKAIRTQANFIEYTPMALILLGLTEMQGAPSWAVHVLGLILLCARLLHAYGFGKSPQNVLMRRTGVGLTFTMLTVTALGLVVHSLA